MTKKAEMILIVKIVILIKPNVTKLKDDRIKREITQNINSFFQKSEPAVFVQNYIELWASTFYRKNIFMRNSLHKIEDNRH